ncbi:MAG: SDR family NAD(P)-dependent oxidoreductase [Pelatocladus maniniholoensis HA4357-MV3]|jgi:acyl transferase domain-containing protein/acyl carrier protein|uniref:Phenolphthiocerol/phthiocerol polyketide synthase subunit E n=1 Tax=Pelatocladus maniniholoensis HA4357-MV3 TaxID=1117104 RepID=A0A9E3H6J4_9NOST|nr:SDR family NAD(P)-dependent oxidoreductase [Pelatocladus maniniholoensis HA4357-MV3]
MNIAESFIDSLDDRDEIAIIGMAGRFPGANKIDSFWQNLRSGVESISFFTDEELISAGVDSGLLSNPNYVKANGILENIDLFDASFFGFSPREAEITDPQHRLFLESVWEALENAGYNSETYSGQIGLFAGVAASSYLLSNLYPNRNLMESEDSYQVLIGNDKDFLPTLVSYKLNLKGPSINIQTACSTSLVAVHLACQSLLNGESDITLAGGITVGAQQKTGYRYQQGGIQSPDGHCRAFDAQAQGTVGGNGLGVVVLKRLEDAIVDGDYIHAVIKGSAVNNDGSLKVGYTAPSVDGQRGVILEALALAGVDPETISYVETHGTGTILGDPIEIKALTQAFHASTNKKGFCAIGSVKTNVGHLDTAAGVTGLIKTVLALKHKQIPPSLHFEKPNPQIDFANSPFYVNTKLTEWKSNGTPRRAGVSSFGIGGTNAHVILEEAPAIKTSDPSRPWQLLTVSAKTSTALDSAIAQLRDYLEQNLDRPLPDVAYTLQVGRRAFDYRRIIICHSLDDAIKSLDSQNPQHIFSHQRQPGHCPVIFMFSGQGSQYANMGRELYEVEPTYKKHVDTCALILQPYLGLDIRSLLYLNPKETETASNQLQQTAFTQSALFVTEYALAQLFMSWGVRPEAMIGHSIGEYVAATIAGVFSLEDALKIVAKRGQLMQQVPPGSMLAIRLPEKDVQLLLNGNELAPESLQIAVINSPSSCVVSGTNDAVAVLEQQLFSIEVECRQLHTSHAFHSVMMEPILSAFAEAIKTVKLNPPKIRFISNVTGSWITQEQATNPDYWCQHLRQTVRFSDGISQLIQQFEGVFLEVGPGRTLGTLTTQHLEKNAKQQVLTSLRHVKEQQSDVYFLLQTLGRLWLGGVEIDWLGFYVHEKRHRLPLPTYPFERQRYWIEPNKQGESEHRLSLSKKPDIADWFYIPFWKPSLPPAQIEHQELASEKSCILVFVDECGLGSKLVKELEIQNQDIIIVRIGKIFTILNEREYIINPGHKLDYDILIQELCKQNNLPKTIVHLWNTTPNSDKELTFETIDKAQSIGFYSLLFLAQTLGRQETADELQILVISNNLHPVVENEKISPEKATLLGPIKVIPQEYSNVKCRSIDVILPEIDSWQEAKLVEQLLAELKVSDSEKLVAYRGFNRWVQSFEPVRFEKPKIENPRLREKGVYLITGGLGGIGLVLAEYLAQSVQAKLVLVGRSVLPEKDEWEQWLTTHDETDGTSRKIRKIKELESNGAKVLIVTADVSNLEQMQNVIAQAQQQFGRLNGVIHAAGVVQGESIEAIENLSKSDCEQQFKPKVQGVLVLENVLKNQNIDFCLLLSSLSSILGGLGFFAYSAANIFMDIFVHRHNQIYPTLWSSISWDGWQLEAANKNVQNTSVGGNLTEFVLKPEEGIKAVKRILNHNGFNHIVVSTGKLQVRINQWINLESLQQRTESQKTNLLLHSRPDLSNSYVVPSNEVEQKIANIWQDLLGIKNVGLYDNFFELGGDSLLIIQVRSRILEELNKNLSIADLFELSTISTLAEYISGKQTEEPIFQQADERASRKEAAMQEKRQLMKQRRK